MKPAAVLITLLGIAAGLGGGILIEREVLSRASAPQQTQSGPKILYWWDPMIPNFKSDKPGKSPMGMDMVPVYEGQEPGPGSDPEIVTVSAAAMNNLGVRTAPAARTTLVPTIETFGTIAFDESRTTHLHVRGKGWIERLHTRIVGERVERGQLLFEFFSQELVFAAFEFVREVQRGTELAELARRKLVALGVQPLQIEEIRNSRQIPERIKVYAPQSGVIVALNVAEGMYIQPDMTLMSITDLDSVWLLAEVFESQAAFVHSGMPAEIRTAAQPARVWKGKVEYVYPDLRSDTRTVRLRMQVENKDGALKPNMYASVRLATTPRKDVVAIPNDALIRTRQGERAVLALGDGRFKPVPVKAGLTVGDTVEILDGIKEGDRVVTSAQFLIDSESKVSAAFAQMEKQGADGGAAAAAPGAEGEIKAVKGSEGKVTISHGPIPALGWPAMTMDFTLPPDGVPAGLAPGDRIRFTVLAAPDGSHTATKIERIGPSASQAPARRQSTAQVAAWTTAKVNRKPGRDRMVNVSHEPVPAIGWPAMTMDFRVDDAVPLDGLDKGRTVRIGLGRADNGNYRIVAVEPAGGRP
ncbi:MAG: efflux RND transporter periplasmic adaptor subunit [Alphaproteobacteria bacterium]